MSKNILRAALVAGLAMTPMVAMTPAAMAQPADCSLARSASGAVASAYCRGGSGLYQIQIRCSNFEIRNGNIARAPGGNSSASCNTGIVTDARIVFPAGV